MKKIGILTSSRADFGIYLPLLNSFKKNHIDFELIVFGTHLSKFHGNTIHEIEDEKFNVFKQFVTLTIGDTPESISTSFALTANKFTEFWSNYHTRYSVVFALGDRFEMAAAVLASVPFQIDIAHLHGGEISLGAIDNIYRHIITHCSKLHFASTNKAAKRILELIDNQTKKVFVAGALSLEKIFTMKLLTNNEFKNKWGIDLNLKSLLITVHPETVDYYINEKYSKELRLVILELVKEYQVIVTMPNADTHGMVYREMYEQLFKEGINIKLIENFGSISYFTCMSKVGLLIGNTSSGIIEAASFGKFVLNLGSRQAGRLTGKNVIHLSFDKFEILNYTKKYFGKKFNGINPYYKKDSSKFIINIIRNEYE